MRCLIVNGDDLGASPGVNRGILEAHRRGILTSASLLVDTPWSAEAAAACRPIRDLSVGLHVDLGPILAGRSLLPPGAVGRAIADQCARFEALMGRPPSHLDAHHNLHRDRRALPRFLETARRLGVPLREHSAVRCFQHYYGRWGGESHPEHIGPAGLARILATEIDEGITELACHPGYADAALASGYAAEREIELRALCEPAVRALLDERAIRLISFHEVDRPPGRPAS